MKRQGNYISHQNIKRNRLLYVCLYFTHEKLIFKILDRVTRGPEKQEDGVLPVTETIPNETVRPKTLLLSHLV